jgi:hypothetical protein
MARLNPDLGIRSTPQMIIVEPGLISRDLAFLQLAEDDHLAELGFHYGNIIQRSVHDMRPIDESSDALFMSWTDCVFDHGDILRQKLYLSVVGPSARGSKSLHREALRYGGGVLLAVAGSRPPIIAVKVAKPHMQLSVGGALITIGFDVFTTT